MIVIIETAQKCADQVKAKGGKSVKKTERKNTRRILAVLLAFAMLAGSLGLLPQVRAEAAEGDEIIYEIYPTPHDITYEEGEGWVIRSEVNVVYDTTIDDATKNRLTEILESKGKTVTTSSEKKDGVTNVFVGTYGSGESAGSYIADTYSPDEAIFGEYGGHYVRSSKDEICILGRDTDAVFYGITSLKHIFSQMDGSTIRSFEIRDYADTQTRGFIEGYYGIPWSNEDRISLMKFGGEFKMTAYVFAPKDDPYHTNKWRELYPDEELEGIKEMVAAGAASKCRFVWTAHPFMGGFNANNVEGEIASLLDKFEQLYSAGVRQFGVLGDDVGSLNKEIVIQVMTAVVEWGKEKGDVLDPVFCPAGYNHSWQGDYSELNTYDAGFPEEVQIFWTGEAVCKPVEQATLDHFRRHNTTGGSERRAPLFWLNWPVNDINNGRLLMGKGSLLYTDINVDDIKGVVTNPMQEAEASKVALFAVADYAWNVKAFDDDQSWADSFKYIEPDAAEELLTLAKHMSNPQPNNHGLVLAESEELQPLITEFKNALTGGTSIADSGARLMEEMDVIINACSAFHANSQNENLKEEVKPFTDSLSSLATSIKSYAAAAIAMENNSMAEAYEQYTQGQAAFTSSRNCKKQGISGMVVVSPGSTHLIPLAETIQEAIGDDINDYVLGGEGLKLTASSSFSSFYNGKIENIIDEDDGTFAWYGDYAARDQYFQVDLSVPATIYGVDILNGTTSKPQDTFYTAKLQYTSNGTDWNDVVQNAEYTGYQERVSVNNIKIDNVVAVRYICTVAKSDTDTNPKWPAMREFKLAFEPDTGAPEFTSEVIRTTDGWTVYSGSEGNAIDGSDSTSVHYNVRQNDTANKDSMIAGDYFGVKLSQPITLGRIRIFQAPNASSNDYMKNATLQYSLDGTDWKDIETYNEQREIDIDLSDRNIEAQYVRLKNNAYQHNWFGIREFEVNAKIVHNGNAYTNVDKYISLPADYLDDSAALVPAENITLGADEYIGLKLDRIHELDTITSTVTGDALTLQTSINGHEWETVTAGQQTDKNARYIRLINLTDSEVKADIAALSVTTVEVYEKSMASNELGALYGAGNNPLALFDGDRTTFVWFGAEQRAGKATVYDLGQEITLDKLKIVCGDSDNDYPRYMRISVSTDNQKWTSVLEIGRAEGEADTITGSLPVHEVSWNTKSAEGISQQARYIKLEVTKNDSHWLKINELEINDGEYLPTVNDPTYESDVQDTPDGKYAYMSDSDLSTMFVPAEDTGSLIYHLSDDTTKANSVKVIQNSSALSNAAVSVRTLGAPDGWTALGTLSQTISEFIMPDDTCILDVKLEWEGVTPNIVELTAGTKTYETVNKDKLNALLGSPADTSGWTADTKAAYDAAYKVAEALKDNANASQETVDSAVQALQNALDAQAIKGDASQVQDAVNNALTAEADYTSSTWRAYQKTVNAAKNALNDPANISVDMVNELLAEIQSAKDALVYNPTAREEAGLLAEDVKAFTDSVTEPEKLYTVNSYKALADAHGALNDVFTANETEAQAPDVFRTASENLRTAWDGLVQVDELPELIKEYEGKDETLYTDETWTAYKAAYEQAKEALVSGTDESVSAAVKALTDARDALKTLADTSALKGLIEEIRALDVAEYTTASYNTAKILADELAGKADSMSGAEAERAVADLTDAKNALVWIGGLKTKVDGVKAAYSNGDAYLADGYNALQAEIMGAEALYENGTKEQVQNAVNAIDQAVRALERKVDKNYAADTVNGIILEDTSRYTAGSARAYLAAYQVLKDMLNNLDNVSAARFTAALEAFDQAEKALTLKGSAGDGTSAGTGQPDANKAAAVASGDKADAAPSIVLLAVSVLAAAGVLTVRKRRNI